MDDAKAARDADAAGRLRSLLERQMRARRNRAIVGAGATYAAAAAAALLVGKLAETTLSAFDIERGTNVLLWLPFVAAIAIVGLAAHTIAAALVRSGAGISSIHVTLSGPFRKVGVGGSGHMDRVKVGTTDRSRNMPEFNG